MAQAFGQRAYTEPVRFTLPGAADETGPIASAEAPTATRPAHRILLGLALTLVMGALALHIWNGSLTNMLGVYPAPLHTFDDFVDARLVPAMGRAGTASALLVLTLPVIWAALLRTGKKSG